MSFQVCQNTFLFEIISRNGVQPDPKNFMPWLKCYPYFTKKKKKELQLFLGMMNYLEKFISATWKTSIIKNKWIWNISNLYDRAKAIIKKDATVEFYNEKEQMYLEIDGSSVGLGANLVQVRDGMWFPKNEAPNIAALWPIAFVSKSLTSAKTQYSNLKRSPRHTAWPVEIPSLLFWPWRQHDNRPQAAGGNFQKRCSKLICRGCKEYYNESISTE